MSKPARKRSRCSGAGVIAPLVVLAVLFVFFEIIARTTGISEYILPAPSKIVSGIWEKFPVDIWPHFILTLKVILIGFAVATALGMLLAALISQSGLVTRAISPVIIWLVITPLITLIPLLTLWLGYDPMQRVYVVIIQATPIITLNTLNGFTNLENEKVELARAVGCTKLQRFMKITFMNAMPQVFTGIKLGCINATIAALSADTVSGNIGMGFKIKQYIKYNNIDLAYGSIILVALIGLVTYNIVEAIEHKVVLWKN